MQPAPGIMFADLEKALPQIWDWMRETVARHERQATSVERYGFTNLSKCFSVQTLQSARVVEVDGLVPRPPLRAIGLSAFAAFEDLDLIGITFGQTYFLKRDHALDEGLHFHELVHVVQWTRLGALSFLSRYAQGLAQHGYENSPLELMAYTLQNRFKQGKEAFDAESEIVRELSKGHLNV